MMKTAKEEINQIKSSFKKFLKDRNLKPTKTRLEVIDLIASYGSHFEIEELVNWIMSKNNSTVSRSTIYRTVKLLQEFGAVKEIIKINNRTIYEFMAGRSHHDHLICVECKKIIEFVDQEIEELQDQVCQEYDFTPINHRLEIFGVCSECKNKGKQKAK